MTKVLSNEKTTVTFEEENAQISGRDKTDHYNDPSFYNQTTRSAKRAWKALEEKWSEQITMYEALNILEANGVRCHSYCAVD